MTILKKKDFLLIAIALTIIMIFAANYHKYEISWVVGIVAVIFWIIFLKKHCETTENLPKYELDLDEKAIKTYFQE
jgi:1-acyl-sn-glycerol-3-phosphate acyltransferase